MRQVQKLKSRVRAAEGWMQPWPVPRIDTIEVDLDDIDELLEE